MIKTYKSKYKYDRMKENLCTDNPWQSDNIVLCHLLRIWICVCYPRNQVPSCGIHVYLGTN